MPADCVPRAARFRRLHNAVGRVGTSLLPARYNRLACQQAVQPGLTVYEEFDGFLPPPRALQFLCLSTRRLNLCPQLLLVGQQHLLPLAWGA